MRASEFITEESERKLIDSVGDPMPATYAFPTLQNNDAYRQYRFGVTLAAARAHQNNEINIDSSNPFGENLIVVARSKEEEEQLKLATSLFGSAQNTLISSSKSEELPGTNKVSPSAPQYSRKLNK